MLGYGGGRHAAQEEEDHHHDERDGEHQLELHVAHRSADGDRAVGEQRHFHRGRQCRLQRGQELFHAVDDFDHVRARLALDVHDDRGRRVGPRREVHVLRAVDDVRDVGQAYRRAVLVGDDEVAVFVGRAQLVVRVDRGSARRAVEAAFRLVHVGVGDCRAQLLEAEPVGGERFGVRAHAHGRALAAAQGDEADAGKLRNFLCEPRIDEVLHLRQRHRRRGDRERHDRRIGRIHFAVERRRRQIGGEQIAGRVDRRLHFLLGDVEAQARG